MSAVASHLTGLSIVWSTVCSCADQRKHQSFASLAFAKGIHQWPVDSPHKGPITQKFMMTSSNGNIFRVTGPLCGEFTGPGEFPAQRPVTWSFDVFFHLRLNKRLSKQPWGWWFETPAWSLWRHRNGYHFFMSWIKMTDDKSQQNITNTRCVHVCYDVPYMPITVKPVSNDHL